MREVSGRTRMEALSLNRTKRYREGEWGRSRSRGHEDEGTNVGRGRT